MATKVSQAAQTLANQTVTTQPGNGTVSPPAAATLNPTINLRSTVSAAATASAVCIHPLPTSGTCPVGHAEDLSLDLKCIL